MRRMPPETTLDAWSRCLSIPHGFGKLQAELDSYGGGAGTPQQKLDDSGKDIEVWIRDGKCLVREKPWVNGYGHTMLSLCCQVHNKQHKWWIQCGLLDATLIGFFDHEVSTDAEYPILEVLLSSLEASYACYNSACSDPFTSKGRLVLRIEGKLLSSAA
jgi:hypothetical protein